MTENGNKIIMDSTEKLGAKPMEMVLMGLGGCASYDVVSILQKARQAVKISPEELRLLYVACTRAKVNLDIFNIQDLIHGLKDKKVIYG